MATPITIDVTGLPEAVIQDIRRLVDTLRGRLAGSPPAGRKPLLGCLEGQGLTVPTLEDIAEVRREMWGDFSRDLPDRKDG